MAELAKTFEPAAAADLPRECAELKAAINEYMWDDEDARFYSQDVGYQTPHFGLGVRQHTELWSTTLKSRNGTASAMLWGLRSLSQ